MCGIAGIINNSGIDSLMLEKMSDVLRHRGPDDEGYYMTDYFFTENFRGPDTIKELGFIRHIRETKYDNHFKLGFLHRRLSIIDLEKTGHQPMEDENGFITIVFNGEIYNYIELKEELVLKGHKFKSRSDTEVIIESYKEWGINCVNRFVGMWAFAIYDSTGNKIFLSRDRFGIKPLYYSFNDSSFAFASEQKALTSTGIASSKIDTNSALEYIAYGSMTNPAGNLLKEINTLPPGTNLEFRIIDWKIALDQYYKLDFLSKTECHQDDKKNCFEKYRQLLMQSIKIHLRSDVPVGSCLSGGLDSGSLVTATSFISDYSGIETFTASFPGNSIDEKPYVDKLTTKYKNLNASFCYPNFDKFLHDFDKLVWYQDYPFNSTSIYSQWEVMKLAGEKGIKVLLDGQGADESLGGYSNFAGTYLVKLIRDLKLLKFTTEYYWLKQHFTDNLSGALSRSVYYDLPEAFKKYLRRKKREGINFISKEYNQLIPSINVPERGGKSLSELSVNSIKYTLSDLLRYEDRNSMAFSIESRVPFLDHRLVEFSLGLEDDFKINKGWTKFILRKTSEPLLPEEITWRKGKLGFVSPQAAWKNDNSKTLLNFLNSMPLPPIINKDHFIKLVNSDLNNPAKVSEFWKIISFVKWSELFSVTY